MFWLGVVHDQLVALLDIFANSSQGFSGRCFIQLNGLIKSAGPYRYSAVE
jgi:hypothetical protein